MKFRYCLNLLGIRCKRCNTVLQYHGWYEVNHISNEGVTRIPILRGVCKKCIGNPTHSIKPCFLPGKHQYDLNCREKAITEYESGCCGLHKALKIAFPGISVSIMNLRYWVLTSRKKAEKTTRNILSALQQAAHGMDVVSEYINKLSGNYLKDLLTLCTMYINNLGFNAAEQSSTFMVINNISNEECTGCYL